MSALKPRRGSPGMIVSFSDRAGVRRKLTADEAGLFKPADAEDDEALARGGLPIHDAKAAAKADEAKPSAAEPEKE